MIAGVVVALASCSQADEMPGQPQEDGQLVTFNIQTPAATRAAVTDLTRYIVEAYEGSSATGTLATRVEANMGTLVVELEKNTEYTFLFWADKGTAKNESTGAISSGYWDTDDLKTVKVTSGKENSQGEVAYCLATTLNTANLTSSTQVTLRNATAQVNFVEKTGVSGSNNTLAIVYSAGATLNVGTGKVTEGTSSVAHIFTGIGPASPGATLATDYILAPKGEQRLLGVTIKFNTDDDQKTLTNVPFQQCYKTNITGEYAPPTPPTPPTTGDFTFTITADDKWEEPDNDHDFTETGWDGTYPADAATAKQWLGEAVSSGTDGTDGKDYVFEISTAKQLAGLWKLMGQSISDAVTATNNTYAYATYKLTADINLNNHPWTPLGSYYPDGGAIYLYGVFDGQGHTISGLNISLSTISVSGLFAGNYGTIKHLMVKGDVEYGGTGGAEIGGIVGLNQGTIAFCSFEGTVKATNADATSEIPLGWICGKNIYGSSDGGNIISCFAKGTISGASNVVKMGGMTAINKYLTEYSGTVSGCTWYYKSGATPEGIEKCYSEWTSGGNNASYSTDLDLSNKINTMNANYGFSNDFKWEAAGSTLKLVRKGSN